MFKLEQSIAEWREKMRAAGIEAPVPLEELELHLRDEIDRRMRTGLTASRAFVTAAKEIGRASELNREFKTANSPVEMPQVIRLAGVVCVAVVLVCPLFLFLPFLLDPGLSVATRTPAVPMLAVIFAAIILAWKYNGNFFPEIRNQSLRRVVGVVCYAGCLLCIRFGLFHFPLGGSPPRSMLVPLFIFGTECLLMSILGGAGHGLEKAAAKKFAAMDLPYGQI